MTSPRPAPAALALALVGLAPGAGAQPPPSLEALPSETVAYLQRTGDAAGVPASIRDLLAWAAGREVEASGPPTAIFYSDPAETPPQMLFWEVRLPVPPGQPDRSGNEVRVLRTEGVPRAACVRRRARPGEAGPEVAGLREWVKRQGLEVNGPRHETYLAETDDGAAVPMRVCFPVLQR
jgi:effector-binding domain-containing protein